MELFLNYFVILYMYTYIQLFIQCFYDTPKFKRLYLDVVLLMDDLQVNPIQC